MPIIRWDNFKGLDLSAPRYGEANNELQGALVECRGMEPREGALDVRSGVALWHKFLWTTYASQNAQRYVRNMWWWRPTSTYQGAARDRHWLVVAASGALIAVDGTSKTSYQLWGKGVAEAAILDNLIVFPDKGTNEDQTAISHKSKAYAWSCQELAKLTAVWATAGATAINVKDATGTGAIKAVLNRHNNTIEGFSLQEQRSAYSHYVKNLATAASNWRIRLHQDTSPGGVLTTKQGTGTWVLSDVAGLGQIRPTITTAAKSAITAGVMTWGTQLSYRIVPVTQDGRLGPVSDAKIGKHTTGATACVRVTWATSPYVNWSPWSAYAQIYRTKDGGATFYRISGGTAVKFSSGYHLDNTPDAGVGTVFDETIIRDRIGNYSGATATSTIHVCNHKNRLWLSTSSGETIYGSRLNEPGSYVTPSGPPVAFLSDDGLYISPGSTDGDPITALKSYRDILMVFKANSVWTVLGDESNNLRAEQLPGAVGCRAGNSVAIVNGELIWVGTDHQVYQWNPGTISPVVVSGPLGRVGTMQPDTLTTDLAWEKGIRGHEFRGLYILRYASIENSTAPDTFIYDPRSGGWWRDTTGLADSLSMATRTMPMNEGGDGLLYGARHDYNYGAAGGETNCALWFWPPSHGTDIETSYTGAYDVGANGATSDRVDFAATTRWAAATDQDGEHVMLRPSKLRVRFQPQGTVGATMVPAADQIKLHVDCAGGPVALVGPVMPTRTYSVTCALVGGQPWMDTGVERGGVETRSFGLPVGMMGEFVRIRVEPATTAFPARRPHRIYGIEVECDLHGRTP